MISSLLPIALVTIIFRKFLETINRQPLPPPINIASYTPAFVIFSALFFYFYTHASRGTTIKVENDVRISVRDKTNNQKRNYVHKKRPIHHSWFMKTANSSRENKQTALHYMGEEFLRNFDNKKSQLNSTESPEINDPVIVSKMSSYCRGIQKSENNQEQIQELPVKYSNVTQISLASVNTETSYEIGRNFDNRQMQMGLDMGVYKRDLDTDNASVDSSVIFIDSVPQKIKEDIVECQSMQRSSSTTHYPRVNFCDRGDMCMCKEAKAHVFLKKRKRRRSYYFGKRMEGHNVAKTTRSGRVYGFFEAN